jgi:carboxylesterase type B
VRDLRFAAPVPPAVAEGDLPVFGEEDARSCFQAVPQWLIDSVEAADLEWETFLRTKTDREDCLFLDVARPT